jgi:hypothetical protein
MNPMGADGCSVSRREPGRRRCLPTARSLPFAWDLGTSRWQLSDQTTPLRNGDPGIAQSQAFSDFTPVVLITERRHLSSCAEIYRPKICVSLALMRKSEPRENKIRFGRSRFSNPLGLRADQFRDWHQCHACSSPWRSTRDVGFNRRSYRLSYCTTSAPLACGAS